MKKILGILGIVVGVIVLAIIAFFVFFSATPDAPEEGITFSIDAPAEVAVGEAFDVSFIVANDSNRERKMYSLDFDEEFFKVIDAVSVPDSVNQEYESFGWKVFEFKKDIPSGESESFDFTLRINESGDHIVDVDACIDSNSRCIYSDFPITVK